MASQLSDLAVTRLPWPDQRRNLILFTSCMAMQYLSAPLLYVGITQSSLCDRLGADTRMANLPATLFFAMTAMPALLAWLSPAVSALQRNLSLCFLVSAAMLGTLAVTLWTNVSPSWKIAMVVIQGAVSGIVMPAAMALLWEVLGRGSDESRRGLALALGFGAGPIWAVAASFGQSAILGGNSFGLEFKGLGYPHGFVVLFALGVPMMGLAACLSMFFVIPEVENEIERAPFSSVRGLIAGILLMLASIGLLQWSDSADTASRVSRAAGAYAGYAAGALSAVAFVHHFREILRQRILLIATLVTILIYCGNMIPSNMNLYTREVLSEAPERFAGIQNTLRFLFKMFAGFGLGWLLTRTCPRAGIVATGSLFLLAQVWAMLATGRAYLVAFGIFGAGELIGVYAPNYFVSASNHADLRRNMAFMTMLMLPAAPAGYLYGRIVEDMKTAQWTLWGMNSATLGFRTSFLVCATFIFSGIVLALARLPRSPHMLSDASTEE